MKATALAPAALALLLGGCLSFGEKPPATLLTLTPNQPIAVGQTQTASGSGTVTIAVPSIPQEIATLRVPVRASDTAVAYVKDTRWVEPPNRLSFTWISNYTDQRPTVVTIEFHERGTGTELVLTHRGLPAREIEGHRQGWTDILRLLDAVLSRE